MQIFDVTSGSMNGSIKILVAKDYILHFLRFYLIHSAAPSIFKCNRVKGMPEYESDSESPTLALCK